jgi:hypothetical protein
VSAKELRANKPLNMSQLELEYFDKNKRWDYSSNSNSNSPSSISYLTLTSFLIK